jgi:hypothetical protein
VWTPLRSWRSVGPALALILALFATDLPVVHAHANGHPGLYNEECPLGRLATPPSAVLRDANQPATALGPAPDPPLTPPALTPVVRPLDFHGARAPPATDPISA